MKIDSTTTTDPAMATSNTMRGTKDEFLKLFMAQLQHQDPLDPKNGSDMVAQLAQFSAVEQAQQTNQQLADLAAAQASTSSAGLSSLIGRTCTGTAADFTVDRGGGVPPLEITATGPMKGAAVVITDDRGKELRRIAIPNGASSAEVPWDGKDAAGNSVPPGSYHVAVEPGTTTATITSQWQGRVDAVELTSDGPRLRMGSLLLAPGDIRTIGTIEGLIGQGVHP